MKPRAVAGWDQVLACLREAVAKLDPNERERARDLVAHLIEGFDLTTPAAQIAFARGVAYALHGGPGRDQLYGEANTLIALAEGWL